MKRNRTPSWFVAYLGRYKLDMAKALALGFAASACAALLMFTSGYLISATALAGTTLFSIMVPVACVQLFGFGRPLARYAERLASHDWVLRVTSDMRVGLFRSIARSTGDPSKARAAGEYLGVLSDDVAHAQNLYVRVVFPSCVAYALAVGAALMFGFFSWPFAGIMLLSFAVVALGVPLCCQLAARASVSQAKELRAQEYVKLSDDASGALDWVLSGRGNEAVERHERADASMRALEAKARMVQRALSLVSAFLLAALVCLIVVWAGGRFGSGGSNVNLIAAFALGFFPLIESFLVLPAAFCESVAQRDALDRLDGYLGTSDASALLCQQPVGPYDATCENALALQDVSYTYPGASRPALNGLSIAFKRGEAVAILGRSGAGKSTLAQVACNTLSPDAGTVEWGGARAGSGDADLSSVVSVVGQSPHLFNRTLRDNLTMQVNDADDETLESILRSVGLGGKLDTLEKGLDTIIGETGVGLSGGEAHRVAIARVLVADTPIVVVDEPLSALDPETERDLLDVLLSACAGRTLLVITHHLALVERFDRVVFIENGKVDLDGTPEELTQTSSRFSTLVSFDRP